jgi:uncharacterized protein (TIGR03083 family)
MGIPRTSPYDYTQLFAVEDGRLRSLLSSLDPTDWQRPTPCPGWDVHGLALHLLGGSFGVISFLRDGFRGTPAPDGADEEEFVGWLDGLQAAWVVSARRISPRLVVELLEWSTKGFGEAIGSQDQSELSAHVSWASEQAVPVWLDHARELTEKWIHRQQILQALGEPADLSPDLARPVMDALRWAYPHRLGAHRRAPGMFVNIEIVDEHIGQQWRLAFNGSSWTFDGATTVEVASMTMSGAQAWRLLSNNYDPALHGAIRTTGDPEIVDTLLRTRAIIGTPK